MKDLGEAEYILGIQIERDRPHRRISICQTGYIQTLLEKFNMTGCKTANMARFEELLRTIDRHSHKSGSFQLSSI